MNGGQNKRSLFRTIDVPTWVVPRAAGELQKEREEGYRRQADMQNRISYYERKKARALLNKKKTAS